MKKRDNYAIWFLAKTIANDSANREEKYRRSEESGKKENLSGLKGRILLSDQCVELKEGKPVLSELTKQLFDEEIERLKASSERLKYQFHGISLDAVSLNIADLEKALNT